MSMPEFIRIAIVSSDRKMLSKLQNTLKLPNEGINPYYHFFTPSEFLETTSQIDGYNKQRFKLWITLDNFSYTFANEQNSINFNDSSYSRGLYTHHLPNPIINIPNENSISDTISLLNDEIKKIQDAFYATS